MLLLGVSHALAATAGPGMARSISATRTRRAPTIDGRLDDPVWKLATADDQFTQTFPNDGAAPTVRTVVRLLYDDRRLYIGVDCLDPEPDKIVARLARRDHTIESDHVSILLDPRHDHDTGFWFWVNAAGVLADAQVHDDNQISGDWNAVWRAKARIHAAGWSVELAIPYSILRFPKRSEQVWGFNVTRFVTRTKENVQWVRVPQSARGALSRAGHVVGIRDLRPRRALELRPFMVARGQAVLPAGGGLGIGDGASFDRGLSAGLDVKYGLTSNLTLDATFLPDFGQVEADAVVLNLSTFEVQFPEKRPFFLENANLFVTDISLLYSRRIGLPSSGLRIGAEVTDARGNPATVVRAPLGVPIYAAARMSGKLSRRFTIAALEAVTGAEKLTVEDAAGERSQITPTPPRNFAAVRGKYSLGGSSYLGFIATSLHRFGDVIDPAQNHDGYAQGIDGRWVRRDGRYRAYFMAAASERAGGPSDVSRADGTLMDSGDAGIAAEAGGGKVAGGNLRTWSNYQMASPRFDVNDVGFENDWDYHKTYHEVAYRRDQPYSILQNGTLRLRLNGQLGFTGMRRDASVELGADAMFRNFWYTALNAGVRPRGTFTTRETSDQARWERPDWSWINLHVSSDSRRAATGWASAGAGYSPTFGTWNAWVDGALAARVVPPLEVSMSGNLSTTRDDLRFLSCIDSAGGACSVRSASRDYLASLLDSSALSLTLRTSWALSTELSMQAYAQLFAARGRRHDYAAIVDQLGPRPHLWRDELGSTTFTGDIDGDGIKDDDFSFANFNANLVLRWEPRPGTTLIGVYTRAQATSRALMNTTPRLTFRGLSHSRTEEVLLLKLTLYFD